MDVPVTVVNACLREGGGGSPTAVLDELPLSDDERRGVPVRLGTSHAVFVSGGDGSSVSLRFFTAEGELPACGHGTVAALAGLAGDEEFVTTVSAAGGVFAGRAVREGALVRASFETGGVGLREATAAELDLVLPGLGVTAAALAPGAFVATLGRSRLLVPLADRTLLGALSLDFDRLRDACDRLDLLGCYVHTTPTATGRVAARMFAPSIGVPEDLANANSTACLAAHLSAQGVDEITVDMGDWLGSPTTITATAGPRSSAPRIRVGGTAVISRVLTIGLSLTGPD